MATIILIALGLIVGFFLYKIIKPYFLRYDKDLVISGPPGSGKTCTGVKEAIKILRKERLAWSIKYKIFQPITNFFRKLHNKKEYSKQRAKAKKGIDYTLNLKEIKKPIPKPELYSFIPIHYKPHWWSNKREWCLKLRISHLLLLEEMTQNNVCLLDDLPQAVNQFNWDIELIQTNFNEYTSEHRHYYNNYNIVTSQAVAEIVVQLRRKFNKTTLMLNFRKIPLLPIYKASCCDIMTNELISTMSSTLFEDNTRSYWGLLPAKGTYDTRCYSERIKNILISLDKSPKERFENLKTNDLIEFDPTKKSPLNDYTSPTTKVAMWEKYSKQIKSYNALKPTATQETLNKIVAEELKEFTEEEKRKVTQHEGK